ncbi:ModD protein [Ignatzschineria cameli]|uniref:Putative pyrophosphorylase ModD n=1 Tax=Ignatzschineria cameli TaxID=2182793 RepID=A0A2U2AKP1_9GAMM|nr:ModD protein [Ignatzschineria cameli]PWD83586.1 ModD protein [Ignatzschineria cameli]PWD88569.1 ModD protein [Ignatzschineria cameli]PWD90005.1 ModD protein [Ignatzschineria cameli]PWD90065.1 ModD protein [Ignatzschineria cameli]
MFMTTAAIERLIEEDIPYIDLTSQLLGIDQAPAEIDYITRMTGVVAGTEIVAKLCRHLDIELMSMKRSGETLSAGDSLLKARGSGAAIHTLWKVGQNILDYSSGVATMTRKMVDICEVASPKVALLTTRKSIPGTKSLAIAGIVAGGAVPHRLGLSETILIFKQHRQFLGSDAALADKIAEIRHLACEKRIVIEADTLEEARRFAKMGVDIIQFDKLSVEALKLAVAELRSKYPTLHILAAGGINGSNIAQYCETGVNGIVTTAPYYAKALDIKVEIRSEA